ncbi:MAG: hypothetical protein JWP30_777 [Homoserinimonas sp.]|nr:hypothetical protein [Homoserinimonas sp.]
MRFPLIQTLVPVNDHACPQCEGHIRDIVDLTSRAMICGAPRHFATLICGGARLHRLERVRSKGGYSV